MERIALTRVDIDNATSRVAKGLAQYCWLQVNRDTRDVRSDPEYRRRFNHFYRVRRGKEWQDSFYGILDSKKGKRVTFAEALNELYRATSRYEASFASKLLATLDPEMPVIDSVVLRNLGLRLPAWTSPNRAERICAIASVWMPAQYYGIEIVLRVGIKS
jgi:hypothetical protein